MDKRFVFSEKKFCSQVICYPELGITVHPYYRELNKVIKVRLKDDTIAKVIVYDCEGRSYVSFYKQTVKLFEQNFINGVVSEEILQMYNKAKGGYVDYAMPNVIPKKDGYARFYDATGKLIKQELWKNGTLINNN